MPNRSINRNTFIGNLGDAPELTRVSENSVVCNFPLALDDSYEKNGETVEQTVWVEIEAWGKLGEICEQYLDRGSQVYIEGKLVSSTWEDEHGQSRKDLSVRAQEVQFLDSPGDAGGDGAMHQSDPAPEPTSQERTSEEQEDTFEPDDSLPF
jgi:single-strand DNA-binding protein